MSTLLIGSQAEAATAVSSGAQKIIAVQFECLTAGTLDHLHLFSGTNWAGTNEVFFGIAAENAGVPGTILGTTVGTTTKPKEKVWTAIEIAGLALVKGTKYWLEALNSAAAGSANIEGTSAGTSTVRVSTGTFTKLEATGAWAAAKANGPLSFYGSEEVATPEGNQSVMLV